MSQDNPQHDPRLDAGRAALIAQLDEFAKVLTEARRYVADAGSDEDAETQRHSAALLIAIDSLLDG
jgi:hypothetical protein